MVYDNSGADVGTLIGWAISFDGVDDLATAATSGAVPYFWGDNLIPSRISVLSNGNVGIAKTNPTARLDIAGTVRIADNSQGVGKVFTSDGTGLGTWQAPVATNANTGFLATVAASWNVPTGTFLTVPFVTSTSGANLAGRVFNDGNNFTGNSYTAPAAGVYHFDASVALPNATVPVANTLALYAITSVSGSVQQHSLSVGTGHYYPRTMNFSFTLKLAAGESVNLNFIQNTGTTITMPVNDGNFFSGYRIY
jgi:hypothetical protein